MFATNKPTTPVRRTLRWSAALLALLTGLAIAAPAGAAPYLRVPHSALGTSQSVSLEVNKSILVDLPTNVGEVIASQPSIATVVMRTKNRAIIQGVTGGDTNIFFLDPAGNNIAVLDIKVFQARSDIGNALETAIARNLPGSSIRVESVLLDGTANRVVLTGTARSQDDLAKATAIAAQFAGSAENVANIATVSGHQQVKLQVVVAEVNRDAIKQFGINLDGSITVGPVKMGLSNESSVGNLTGVVNGSGASASVNLPNFSLAAELQALERRGAVRELAKPTLTAMSGQPAEFNVGGEFPYTTVVDGQSVTAFKPYGVFLNFTPTLKTNGMIQVLVDTAVREPAGGGAVTSRSAKTTVELPAGQTLAIAGMLQDKVRQQISQLPGLGNIPILGTLFRSRDFVHSQTELVIMVTPYLASPGYDTSKPTDNFVVAGDAEAVFLGRMEAMYGVGKDGMRGTYRGSVGFVLD